MNASKPGVRVNSYAIIILAAGSSSRLGRPKQLLRYNHKTLLDISLESAKQTRAECVIVVLGSGKSLIENNINNEGLILVENEDWETGMASSIRAGIKALINVSPRIDAAILMVCDQPFTTTEILNDIISEQAASGKAIVGSVYDDTTGTPALFHQSLFPELLSLTGDHGAKKLFQKYKTDATFVPFQKGGIDIDTSEDYNNLMK
jgi:molybdenum cofactor cytidylyltransferase